MKKILMAAAMLVAGLITAGTVSARGFGVTGGFNFNSVTVKDLQMDTRAGFNLGVTYLLDLPLGLSVQPSLVYSQNSLDYSVLESIEAMQKVADGQATKIIIPSEMQGLVGLANGITEGVKEQ